MDLAKEQEVPEVYLHLFGDGKDAPPNQMKEFMEKFMEKLKEYPNIKVGSIVGRYYSMDRDDNWDRTSAAYNLLVNAKGNTFQDPVSYIEEEYKKDLSDILLEPAFLADKEGGALGRIKEGDAVVFYNFREDSVRQLTSSFIDERMERFERRDRLNLYFVTMTEYDKRFPVHVAFPALDIHWPLSRVISDAGLKQLHIAESEKYAHVTYFFNGGIEKPFPGEERILVHSPATHSFDERPEMSADKVTDAVINNVGKYDFILANFANGDLVGHTGNFEATVKAIEVLDFSVGKIVSSVLEVGGVVLITSDHGNAEEKRYRITGERRTEHTTNPVPFYLISNEARISAARSSDEVYEKYKDVGGVLTDISPTVLELIGIQKPSEMTGYSLLDKLQ